MKSMKYSFYFFRAGIGGLACLIILGATCGHASVTTVAWYRMGENDPGATAGLVVSSRAVDLVGTDPLRRLGLPVYGRAESSATLSVGSSLAVRYSI